MFNRSSYPVSKHIRPVKSTSELIHPDFDSGRFSEPKETDQYLQYITFLLLRPVRNFREKWSQSSMASVKSAQTTRERSSRVWWTHVWQVFSRGGVFLLWPSENSAKKHRRERWLSERTVELFVSDRNGFLELFLNPVSLKFLPRSVALPPPSGHHCRADASPPIRTEEATEKSTAHQCVQSI